VYSGGILPYIVLIVDELADLMLTVQGEIETPARGAGAEGARHRDSPDPRDPASLGERHHGIDQGKLPVPDRVSGFGESRQPHDSRSERRRNVARQRRHAVSAARQERADARARRVHFHRRDRETHGNGTAACSGCGRHARTSIDEQVAALEKAEKDGEEGRGTGEGDVGDRDHSSGRRPRCASRISWDRRRCCSGA